MPADGHVAGLEYFAQLVADQIDDGLEIELRGDSLLDAVDDGQLAGALLQFGGAPGHLALQPGGETQVGERHSGLARQHGQQVAVAVVEAAERAVDVGIDVPQQVALYDQRHDQVAALRDGFGAVRCVAQAYGAVAASLQQPLRHGFEERVLIFALGHQRSGNGEALRSVRRFQH